MSPNQDYVVSSIAQVFVRIYRFVSWLLSGASQRQDEEIMEEMDSDDEDGDTPDDEPEAQAEDMIGFLAGYSTDLVCTFLSPVFLILCTWVYEESQILERYDIRKAYVIYYLCFFVAMLFF